MDDATAIERSLRGDPRAFRHLVERYEREAFAHALAITGDRAAAQDAVQEAMVDAWRNLARFERSRKFYPWLYTLLRNRCLKALATRRAPASLDGATFVEPTRGAGDEAPDLERALAHLEPEQRELVLLKHLDGLSYDELAERLGVPPGTVMSRLHNARKRMKEFMDRAPGEGAPDDRPHL